MIIAFFLSMPNVGSWNGRWSGAGEQYVCTRTVKSDKADTILQGHNYYYNFGDGWGASVSVKLVDGREASKLRKHSHGFCGYEWMIDEIVTLGKIRTLAERYPPKAAQPAEVEA